jgi:hypothetical protein
VLHLSCRKQNDIIIRLLDELQYFLGTQATKWAISL